MSFNQELLIQQGLLFMVVLMVDFSLLISLDSSQSVYHLMSLVQVQLFRVNVQDFYKAACVRNPVIDFAGVSVQCDGC